APYPPSPRRIRLRNPAGNPCRVTRPITPYAILLAEVAPWWCHEGRATNRDRRPLRRDAGTSPESASGDRVSLARGGVLAIRILRRRRSPVGSRHRPDHPR